MERNNFIFLDSTQNYPLEFSAGNSKVEIMAKGLIEQARKVYVINPCFGSRKISSIIKGEKDGILYKVFPKKGKLYSIYCLFLTLKEMFLMRKEYKYIVYTQNHYIIYLLECLYAKLLGYKIGVLYHELRYTTFQKPSLYTLYNAKLFDYTFGYFCDFILPISHFLKDRCKKYNKPLLMTPILSDFSKTKDNVVPKDYFLYCGSVEYKRIIDFILSAFEILSKQNIDSKLILVLSGDETVRNSIQKEICNSGLENNISIKYKLSYDELLKLFSEAKALLIPLDSNNLQDKARFSQKIAEYVSTKRPIITNSVGEIPYYFNDKSAYIAQDTSATTLSDIMKDVYNNPRKATLVGQQGYDVGALYFDYKKYTLSLLSFLKNNYE